MPIDLTTATTGLFPRLGGLGQVLYVLHPAQENARAAVNAVLAAYAAPDEDLTAALAASRDGLVRGVPPGFGGVLRQLGVDTLLRMVEAAEPARAGTTADALAAVFRQMTLDGESVAQPAEGVTATAFAGQVGTGTVVLDPLMPDGRANGLIVPESVAQLVVVRDSRTGNLTEGSETLRYVGEPDRSGTDDYDWPQGSAADATFTGGSAQLDYPTGRRNLLVNGSFDEWAVSTVPDHFALVSGAITEETSLTDGGAGSAVRVAAGQTPVFTQLLGDSTGTTAVLSPLTAYAVAVRVRGSAALSGGTLTLEWHDGTSVVNDDAGNPARVTVALSGTTTSYAWRSGVLRTPAVVPAGVRLRVAVTVTPVGGDLLLDRLAVSEVSYPYDGGPGLAVFAGPTAFATGDGWTVAATNTFAGADYAATWVWLLDRLFDLKGLGLRPPYSGSPTVSDTLITAAPAADPMLDFSVAGNSMYVGSLV